MQDLDQDIRTLSDQIMRIDQNLGGSDFDTDTDTETDTDTDTDTETDIER